MAVTSGWSWKNIIRGVNVNVYAGITRTRNNWTLNRARISNDTYSSQLLERATSLDAANGGVTETISAPSVNSVTFVTTGYPDKIIVSGSAFDTGTYVRGANSGGYVAWYIGTASTMRWSSTRWEILHGIQSYYLSDPCSVTDMPFSAAAKPWVKNLAPSGNAPTVTDGGGYWAGAAGSKWIETGFERGGYPVYIIFDKTNSPLPYLQNVVWLSTTGTTAGKWCAAASTLDDVEQNSFLDEAKAANYANGYAVASTSGYTSINGIVFVGAGGWLGVDATATLGTNQISMVCESDEQAYDQNGVDWYTQRQRWTYIDSWVRRVSA
jgi:hypothetical protein